MSRFELAVGASSPVHSHRSLNTNVFTINLYAIGTYKRSKLVNVANLNASLLAGFHTV